MEATEAFEAQRARLLRLATRVLGDHAEAEDVVQQAWLRLHAADGGIDSVPAWLTTVTTRLCLDRLRARTPVPVSGTGADALVDAHVDAHVDAGAAPDPADEVVLADSVGTALHVVLERLSPPERVAFVLHDSFAVDFATIAAVLGTTPVAARKLASRARAKVGRPAPQDRTSRWEVVDAFMAAARGGDLARLVQLLAPDVRVRADDAAVRLGTPQRIDGAQEVAAFFDGSAHAALPVLLEDRPGAAWFHRGRARVLFDFEVSDGLVRSITFRAEPALLARLVRRDGGTGRT
ncbi:sigma-70 family RNA polymerase sigma factor [Kineococcus sp. SYSU DK005]|uniref:sigma-70 family RNA polymerase sigma factor n=1 Tax=Kineococcus sp. SYSU DK005 TaxID=3383126 RepID=UPI003D7E75C1